MPSYLKCLVSASWGLKDRHTGEGVLLTSPSAGCGVSLCDVHRDVHVAMAITMAWEVELYILGTITCDMP